MARRIGEILVDDLGWDQAVIDSAVKAQLDQGGERERIGQFLRATEGRHTLAMEVGLALALQRLEYGPEGKGGKPFDLLEYGELGDQLIEDREDMAAKVRAYALVLVGLVLFVAYPVNAVLTASPIQLQQWSGLAPLYSSLGILIVFSSLFLGDGVVKSYAFFVKRRWRVAVALRELRASAISRGDATVTVMPHREATATTRSGVDILERPDPEIAGVQHFLPLFYTLGALAKLGLMAFFIACWMKQSLQVDKGAMYKSVALVLAFGPAWYFFVGMMCERYHKTLFEAARISVARPYPRASTRHLADGRRRSNQVKWFLIYGGGWVGMMFLAAQVFADPEDMLNWLWVVVALSVIYLIVRVFHVLHRVAAMRLVE